ncbi:TIGR02300 family protein [Hansschlegelia sp.]|uniref:TIGR02300 family protein n=1 Tax=Hansschlegelia sp. TaxID=2041892 RepID=UPI002C9EBF75|nr:TIGR02300 family protein [Hansschlegelia sp.]HVI27857.1 TIGR02300 family protein [Hansschlegelia sp.]
MAKPELGVKRTCPSCSAKYYDLMRDPPVCPKCGATFVATVIMSSAAVARAAKADAARNKAAVVDEEEDVEKLDADEDIDAISLEDADEEASATEKVATSEDDDEVEIDSGDDEPDETFLEPDEDSDDDMTDIIGDREKDDEA